MTAFSVYLFLHYIKRQVHFLSFIDKTMHKSFDYVCGFSRVSQCSRNIAHGFSGTSVYQLKYTVMSAYSGAFFLNLERVVFLWGRNILL